MPQELAPNSLGIQDVNGVAVNLPSSYMQQWNLSLDKQIGQNGFRISYIGESSVHLPYGRNLNQPVPSTTPYSPICDRSRTIATSHMLTPAAGRAITHCKLNSPGASAAVC